MPFLRLWAALACGTFISVATFDSMPTWLSAVFIVHALTGPLALLVDIRMAPR